MNDPVEKHRQPETQPLDLLLGIRSPVFCDVLPHTHLGCLASPLGAEGTPLDARCQEGTLRPPGESV